jgi:hypothetical protein
MAPPQVKFAGQYARVCVIAWQGLCIHEGGLKKVEEEAAPPPGVKAMGDGTITGVVGVPLSWF